MKFVGQKGWIIGDDGNQGIILHTTNGGDTWAIQPHNTGKHYFRGLSFRDSLNGLIVGGFRSMGEPGFILRTSDGGQTWSLGTSPTTYNLNRVCFLDTLHIWMTSDTSAIFWTTDGGNTWGSATVDRGYLGIDFVDLLKGFAVSGPGIFEIAKTTDGGQSWNYRLDGTLVPTSSIEMADSLKGWSAGWPNEVILTTDGWQTWTQVPCGGGGFLNDISFHDTLNGFMVGGENNHHAQYYKTTDGGLTWTVDSLTHTWDFNGVDAKQLPVAWMAGDGGSILKTTTSGNTRTVLRNVDITRDESLNNVLFSDPNHGWAVGTYGAITHTTNGGTVWTQQASGTTHFIYGVSFPTPQKGWVCSDGAEILTTTNSGSTWAFQTSNSTSSLFSIDFGDTLVGVAVGGYYGPEPPKLGIRDQGLGIREDGRIKEKEQILRSTQNDSWRGYAQDDTIKPWGTGRDFWKWPWKPRWDRDLRPEEANPQTAYRTITRTTNGGALWIAQNTTGQVPLYGVSFVSPSEGWACGDPQGGMGVILHTTDSGATWQGQTSNVNQSFHWIQFLNSLQGWTVGSGGTALWTTDGGNTWNQGNTGTTVPLWSCSFYDTLNGFACGSNGFLIKTTDGGRNWTSDTSHVYANLTAVNALDSLHAWAVGSFGMVMGWREAGILGIEEKGQWMKRPGCQWAVLGQSYPNPTTGIAAFEYELPKTEKVTVRVYNLTGQAIRTLAEGMETSGKHVLTWDGKDSSGKKVGSGTYFYRLEVSGQEATKKMVVVR